MNLIEQKCVACEGDVAPFVREEAEVLIRQVPGWEISSDVKSISRGYKFEDFKSALLFVNKVGAIAESEGHHPDIELGWGKVNITLTTHAIDGISQNDFILAAKIDEK